MNNLIIRAKIKNRGSAELTLSGHCMDPLILPGDKGKLVSVSEIRKGLLCIIENDVGELVMHRVVKISGDNYITKGDRTGKYEIVKRNQIIGCLAEISLEQSGTWISVSDYYMFPQVKASLSEKQIRSKTGDQSGKVKHFLNTHRWYFLILVLMNRITRKGWKIKTAGRRRVEQQKHNGNG